MEGWITVSGEDGLTRFRVEAVTMYRYVRGVLQIALGDGKLGHTIAADQVEIVLESLGDIESLDAHRQLIAQQERDGGALLN